MKEKGDVGSLGASLRSTVDEHRDCMRIVSEVEACLDRPPDREGRWIGTLRDRLADLSRSLRSHFLEEERGALYREIPVQFPRFADRVDRLAAEHGGILKTIDGALRRADALRDPELHELREFNARIQLLVATIRRHEAEENEVIMSAHADDVGTGD